MKFDEFCNGFSPLYQKGRAPSNPGKKRLFFPIVSMTYLWYNWSTVTRMEHSSFRPKAFSPLNNQRDNKLR
jgi:hypothetical protein